MGSFCVAAFGAVLTSASCSTLPEIKDPPARHFAHAPKTGRIIIYGDTRGAVHFGPINVESLRRKTDYETERQLVTARLAEEKPDLIVHSGDIVERGSSAGQWLEWERDMAPLRQAGVPLYMAWGNHEYWADPGEAAGYIAERFPHLGGAHWYAVQYDRLLIVVLDSNFTQLASQARERQNAWLEATLAQADAAPEIEAVFLVAHHSPYTNSTTHPPHEDSQNNFVARAKKSKKVRAYISGHVHNYERFFLDGIHFVVAGGGGAPQTKVNITSPKYPDQFQGPEIRPFQYCLVRVDDRRIAVDVMMLRREDRSWARGDGFTIER